MDDEFFQYETPNKFGVLNCPTCGRFAKVVAVRSDPSPEMYFDSWIAKVFCKTCGPGQQT